ncbi:MAG: EamA family transporter [Alphaproteobacteria bacterium]|nr:EamA family transporter [Alphaproteobacteria bacterium]
MTESGGHRLGFYAVLALVVGASATALNPVFVRLTELDPSASAFHRMAWALPLMWGWVLVERPRDPSNTPMKNDRWLLALCGLFFAGDLLALHWAIELTAVANAILFLNAQPIYVALGAWLLFGERISAGLAAGIAIGIAGAAMMVGTSAGFGGERLLGDGLGVVAGLCYAGYILTASRLRARFSSAVINAWTCAVATPVLLMAALMAGRTVIPGTLRDWMLMIALGVISQAAGQGFIVWALAHLPAGFSALALLSAPVAAALFAWVLLNEPISTTQLLGMSLVLAGVYAAFRASRRHS